MVKLGNQTLPLLPQTQAVALPANAAVLTLSNQPTPRQPLGHYQGCTTWTQPANLGKPLFQLQHQGQSLQQPGAGEIKILDPAVFSVVEITSAQGVARTGPGTDYSRLTPLPQGTQARVTGQEGEWLRLDYGGWIRQTETRPLALNRPPQTMIRSIRARQLPGWTEIVLPLQVPVPLAVDQRDATLTLTLFNTTAQTDTILLGNDPILARLDWQQLAPAQVQYRFQFKSAQQWGYKLRYEGTSLILSLRHPPVPAAGKQPLAGIKILLDPGHGSPNDLGARGPTGYPEKEVTLGVSQLLRQELQQRGANVVLTRSGDEDLYPQDRVDLINAQEPAIALSLHYNALPDNGDALNTQGIGSFWYHPQSHDLAVFLHDYLVSRLNRPSYGIFWNNLALTRPTVAPTVLLELGFMINPQEFEWIVDPQAQKQLAVVLADGMTQWLVRSMASGQDK